jgi:hypothetical protein
MTFCIDFEHSAIRGREGMSRYIEQKLWSNAIKRHALRAGYVTTAFYLGRNDHSRAWLQPVSQSRQFLSEAGLANFLGGNLVPSRDKSPASQLAP